MPNSCQHTSCLYLMPAAHQSICTQDCPALSCLQDKGRMFREAFLNKLSLLLRGTVAAPADRFGETLADEHMMGGETPQHSSNCHSSLCRALLQTRQAG